MTGATDKTAIPAGTLMQGKRGLIMGVANNRSIAWGIAKACQMQGAQIALTYQGDALKKRWRQIPKFDASVCLGRYAQPFNPPGTHCS